ncbi:uncharacterized protein MONBRDRAFT_25354 [Monosiga brevicollis MX1]|uniref:Fibrinogen C-terminal domain-containing protein n=1 Tax=Monosiga brevicollis TaxID=81824 RepID=A9UZ59_MONBE|nr:uncharacterized protein MONBRDRAFT_25354 [Monosiga brevicollis MX1]EDQ89308.1 predicted protein [Monosiga brevicollis MX1]|eukprot:XP_001745884.1 hypothetical protein [Monosiga brevicollis MX1]
MKLLWVVCSLLVVMDQAMVHTALASDGAIIEVDLDGNLIINSSSKGGHARLLLNGIDVIQELSELRTQLADATNTKVQEYCVFDGQFTGSGSSSSSPAVSCSSILQYFPERAPHISGVYWIEAENALPALVYCDMETEGGGWTLVAKVKGQDAVMNGLNTAQWRDGDEIGSTASLSDENALGPAYSTTPFTDVMVRSLTAPDRNMGWRHPTQHANLRSVVRACNSVDDGQLLFGAVHNLDYPGAPYGNNHYRGCTRLKYGMLLGDTTALNYSGYLGCPSIVTGHSLGVVGAAIPASLGPTVQDTDTQRDNIFECVTNFGVGSGYSLRPGSSGDDVYALNAHWWSAGNNYTNAWNSHGVFLRDHAPVSWGGDGSSKIRAGLSCQTIKERFGFSDSGLRWIFADETPGPGQAMPVWCDMSAAGVSLGSDGTTAKRWSRSCSHIKMFFPHAALKSTSAWVWDTKYNEAREVFCDQKSLGGGWELTAKSGALDGTLNSRNWRNLKYGVYLNQIFDTADANGLGTGYYSAEVEDVMIRSLAMPTRLLAYHMPSTEPSTQVIVNECRFRDNGILLAGSPTDLEYWGSGDGDFITSMRMCSAVAERRYGFLVPDTTGTSSYTRFGCSGANRNHALGVFGYGIAVNGTRTYGSDDGIRVHCLTNFGMFDVSSGTHLYAINAHWWGAGNAKVANFKAHGAWLAFEFQATTSGKYWLRRTLAATPVQVWCEFTQGSVTDMGGDGSSELAAASDCRSAQQLFGQTTSGSYWLFNRAQDSLFSSKVYCDMTTESGGWTLVAIVKGNDATLNSKNWDAWRHASLVGSTETMADINALGPAYVGVPFSDVMIRSVNDPSKNLGWRHPTQYDSLHSVIYKCEAVTDGAKLFGGIANLDSTSINNGLYVECANTKFGMFVPDETISYTAIAGCGNLYSGYAGAIVGWGVLQPHSSTNCLTNGGLGAGYAGVVSGDDIYAINAHNWGFSNDNVSNWNSHAIFVRRQ